MISFEGKSSPLDVIVDRIRFLVASWVSSLLPDFMGLALDQIVINWKEMALPLSVCE